MRRLAVGLVLIVAGAAALGASAGVSRTDDGVVRAVVSGKSTGRLHFAGAHLRIMRRGVVRLDVALKRLSSNELVDLLVRDLDRDGDPEVVVDIYTRGAHCCAQSLIYRFDAARRRYTLTFRDWGNAGYGRVDLDTDGRPELRSADDRFAYAFTSYAASADPIQIWRFDHGRLLDVTRRFPDAIETDATMWWREVIRARQQRQRPDLRGLLAAWAADMHLLGRGEESWRQLEIAYRRGELNPGDGWEGRTYLRRLKAYLRKLGYA